MKRILSVLLIFSILIMLASCTRKADPISAMENDKAAADTAIREAIDLYVSGGTDKTYNGKTFDSASIGDVLAEYGLSDDILSRNIDDVGYVLVFTDQGTVAISGGEYSSEGIELTADTLLSSLTGETGSSGETGKGSPENSAKAADALNQALFEYYSDNRIIKYNKKQVDIASIGDVLKESKLTKEALSYNSDGTEYCVAYTTKGNFAVVKAADPDGIIISERMKISYLAGSQEVVNTLYSIMSENCKKVDKVIKDAAEAYKSGDSTSAFGDMPLDSVVLNDLLCAAGLGDNGYSEMLYYYIGGVAYHFVFVETGTDSDGFVTGDVKISKEHDSAGIELTPSTSFISLIDGQNQLVNDGMTLDKVIGEAVANCRSGNNDKTYNGKTAIEATVGDVLAENKLSDIRLQRTLMNVTYTFVFNDQGRVVIGGGKYDAQSSSEGIELKADTTIKSLAK